MKSYKLLAVLLACFATSAFGQIPQKIKEAFQNKYPNAVVKKFKFKNEAYIATFKQNGSKCWAIFGEDGKWLQTDIAVKWKDIPASVRAGLEKSQYKGWLVESSTQVESPQGTMYSVEVDNQFMLSGDRSLDAKDCYVYFTPTGGFVREQDIK